MMDTDPQQKAVVADYFKSSSPAWGSRYQHRPKKMSDLDLLLRRENVHYLLRPLVEQAEQTLEVLDLGCGTGDVLDGLPRETLRVSGTDYVEEMVAVAASGHPLDHFFVSDAQQLPLRAGAFDLVTCLGVLEYLPEPAAALRNIARVLKPGGHLVMSFPNRKSLSRRISAVENPAGELESR